MKHHFIGIGGIGMSGLAQILLSKKIPVSGSDITSNPMIEKLQEKGATVFFSHSEKYITPEMTVIYSSSIKEENPEFQIAKKYCCKLLHRSDLLHQLAEEKNTLAVAGTHGKTTTSALLTWVLTQARKDPSYAIGGVIPQLDTNAHSGNGEFFILEADESDGSFTRYHPKGGIITNIGLDHLDHYNNKENLLKAFEIFISNTQEKNLLLWCYDDENLRILNPPGISYGFNFLSDFQITKFQQKGWGITFDAVHEDQKFHSIDVSLIGKHNVLNAMAVFGLALKLGIKEEEIRIGLSTFPGTKRRCEIKSDEREILILDDYAHHPTEIETTLKGIRSAIQERRLIAIFQPHRYTRTRDCLGLYNKIFDSVDLLIITDIYPSGEKPIPNITPQKIQNEIKRNSLCLPYEDIEEYLSEILLPHDVVVTLGAGNITNLKFLSQKKLKVGLVFGGPSEEFEISILSSKNTLEWFNNELYDVQLIGITKEGYWLSPEESLLLLEGKRNFNQSKKMPPIVLDTIQNCDLLFPMMHGPFGEDGLVQGFFESLSKPYIGPDFRSAAICMDKALTKKLMQANHISTSPFISFHRWEWKALPNKIQVQIEDQLEFPMFVKPVHLGSSIGVSRVHNSDELVSAIEHAFLFDHEILVENRIAGREFEFAVMGNDNITVFPPGEVCTVGQVYHLDAKYGSNCIPTKPRADLPEEKISEGIELAKKAYQSVKCSGMARVDFFFDHDEKFWLNEINPLPGFTKTSLFPLICKHNGLDFQKMIDRLIILALHRARL